MEKIIAYCGIICSDCPAYVATQNNDDVVRQKVAQEWSSEQYQLQPEDINCDGCLAGNGVILAFCQDCPTRRCAIEKAVRNCAHCAEFPCDNLKKHWEMAQMEGPRKTLMDIFQQLST